MRAKRIIEYVRRQYRTVFFSDCMLIAQSRRVISTHVSEAHTAHETPYGHSCTVLPALSTYRRLGAAFWWL
jgi:hypothetical protein